MSIKYIVELTIGTPYPPDRALTAVNYERQNNIYVFQVGEAPTNTYWTDWGGTYDMPESADLQIFFEQFLQEVTTSASLILTENSFFVDGDKIFLNIPRKPWQYLTQLTSTSSSLFYSTSVRDENKPSDNTYENSLGAMVKYPTRLQVPSLNSKISDAISGSFKLSRFKISLINDDGAFDDIQETNFFNTPIIIKRADNDDPVLSDFKTIRQGLVDSVAITGSGSSFDITGADFITTFTEAVNRKFTTILFPGLPASNVNKDIPIAYGPISRIPLFNVGVDQWVGIDPDYLVSYAAVYDKDGVSISFSVLSGVITATDAVTADVVGKVNNKIAEIIIDEVAEKSNIPYLADRWDVVETNLYVSSSATVGFYFASGNVRKLINEVLKNDSAFLITKNNGLLSLRQWGNSYDVHDIDEWTIIEIPNKDTAEGKLFYTSSVNIKYRPNQTTGPELEYFNDDRELDLIDLYRKSFRRTYITSLLELASAENLGELLLDRFSLISETLAIKLGYVTVDINMLDTVNLNVQINERKFSRFTEWIVREVNPAQDVLTLESV